jgi:hypothetical protein
LSEISFVRTLRKFFIERRRKAANIKNFTVIIRSTDESNYKNTVDVLDEMKITNQLL